MTDDLLSYHMTISYDKIRMLEVFHYHCHKHIPLKAYSFIKCTISEDVNNLQHLILVFVLGHILEERKGLVDYFCVLWSIKWSVFVIWITVYQNHVYYVQLLMSYKLAIFYAIPPICCELATYTHLA